MEVRAAVAQILVAPETLVAQASRLEPQPRDAPEESQAPGAGQPVVEPALRQAEAQPPVWLQQGHGPRDAPEAQPLLSAE